MFNPDGQYTVLADGFRYSFPPSTVKITPKEGTLEGGQQITIVGNRFLPGATVFIGGTEASVVELSRREILAVMPPSATEGPVDVVVRNPDGQESTLKAGFTYRALAVEPRDRLLTTLGFVKQTRLLQNYPNPSNPETWIPYQLQEASPVTIQIYGAQGGLVRTLFLGQRGVGFYRSRTRAAYWDGRNDDGKPVASGFYFYQLRADDFSATRRMLILK